MSACALVYFGEILLAERARNLTLQICPMLAGNGTAALSQTLHARGSGGGETAVFLLG
jgi:hypothetical protein